MSFRYSGRVPLPPPDAEYRATMCQFCNVGCGYDVYVWPVGRDGSPEPGRHGISYKVVDEVYGREIVAQPDFTKPLITLSAEQGTPWISEAMVVKTIRRTWDRGRGTGQWQEVYAAQIPSPECPINWGNASVRGGTNAERMWSPWTVAGERRLKYPLVRFGGRLERVSWDYAIDLVARIVKGTIDRWGIDRGMGKEGHDVFAHRMDHGGGGGGAMIENMSAGLFFFYGVRTAFARIHNRPFFGPENPAIGDAGPDAMNTSLMDLRLADTIIYWGANSYTTGTVMFIKHALDNVRGATADEKKKWYSAGEPVEPARIIVVDPRWNETSEAARAAAGDRAMHIFVEPGTDIVLANAVARTIYERYRDVVDGFVKQYREGGLQFDENAFRLYLEEALEVGRSSLDDFLSRAVETARVSCRVGDREYAGRQCIELAAEWIGEPKAGAFPKRVWLMYEKGIIWNQNYRSIYSLVDLCMVAGALRGLPGCGCQRQGGHQEGYSGPAPPPPPWEDRRVHVSPWNYAMVKGIRLESYDDYKRLYDEWFREVYGGYDSTKVPAGDRYMPTTDFRISAGQGKVLWVQDMDNYRLGPNSQRLKAAVADRAWRVTRSVFADAFSKIGGEPPGRDWDVGVLDITITTPISSEEYANRVLDALERTGGMFVVVQDIYPTFMVEDAHVVLPAAFNNGEVPDVRMSVHERRFRIADAWLDPPGEAKPDWWIYARVAKRIVELYEAEGRGSDPVAERFRRAFEDIWAAMDRNARDPTVEVENEIFVRYIANRDEMERKLGVPVEVQFWTPAFKKLDLNVLRKLRTVGLVLPLTEVNVGPDGTVEVRGVVNRMEPAVNAQYREEVVIARPDGTIIRRVEMQASEKARRIGAAAPALRAWPAVWNGYPPYVRELLGHRYWILNGRFNEIWQTGYQDPNSEVIIRRYPFNKIMVHPEDARREGLQNGDVVLVYNKHGSVPAVVWITETTRPGKMFLIMAHPYMVAVNAVTSPSVEPVAQNPDYKLVKADIRKVGRLDEALAARLTFTGIRFR